MSVTWPPSGGPIGAIIAIIVLVLALLLGILGRLPWEVAGLIAALAVARLL